MDSHRLFARKLRNECTDAERKLWYGLRGRQVEGFRFRRQVPLGPYVVDFVCPRARLIVELDGGQHLDDQAYDAVRTARLGAMGYRVIRFWNHDVLQRTDDVLAEIHRQLTEGMTPPNPPLRLRRKGGLSDPEPHA